MALSDIASGGSLISGLAVLASLIYLARQLRQAEKNQRALMNQGVVARMSDTIMRNNEPGMNELITRVLSGEKTFSASEIVHLRNYQRVRLNSFQDVFVQHRAGLVDQITFENVARGIRLMIAQPVYRTIWETTRNTYAPEWTAYMERLAAETPLAEPVDLIAQFNAALAEVEG